jgi:hypothetical protein
MSNCVTFGSGARSGTKITLLNPMDAAMPAHDEAALPVLAQAMMVRRFSLALTTPMELARSFSDPVAFRPSSFKYRVPRPI